MVLDKERIKILRDKLKNGTVTTEDGHEIILMIFDMVLDLWKR